MKIYPFFVILVCVICLINSIRAQLLHSQLAKAKKDMSEMTKHTDIWDSSSKWDDNTLWAGLKDAYQMPFNVRVDSTRAEVRDAMSQLTFEEIRSESPAFKAAVSNLQVKGITITEIR